MGRRGRRKERDGTTGDAARRPPPPSPSARYTPPQKKPFRFRPDWQRPLGWAVLVLGITIAVVNDLAFFDIRVLPGGHNELYLLLGILVAAGGTWFLGLFDRSI